MDRKPNKAFTIVEMLVAMALAVIVMGLASVIFARAVTAYRKAEAAMEITRRADAICQQLTNDFRGLRKDAPLAVWFERDGSGRHYDQILFFANGNFQTIKQYDSDGNGLPDKTINGNVSRIQYGHANQFVVNREVNFWAWSLQSLYNDTKTKLFSRRVHLMTEDMTLIVHPGYQRKDGTFTYPEIIYPFPLNATNPSSFATNFLPTGNNLLEFDRISLSEWKNIVLDGNNCDRLITICFAAANRPAIDMKTPETLHLLLSERVAHFQVQWAYRGIDRNPAEVFDGIKWWPNEPAAFERGVYFNMAGGTNEPKWKTANDTGFVAGFMPKALKFTFTLYDSKGLFTEGKTFTHIVMIDN